MDYCQNQADKKQDPPISSIKGRRKIMDLVDMKRPKKTKEELKAEVPALTDPFQDHYPYGLRITLKKDELKKLGIDPKTLDVGSACSLQAEGKVEEVSLREAATGREGSQSISIQITKLAIVGGKKGLFQGFNETKKAGPGGKI
jgi:hypothetical protein